jgi:hypothetical protein
MNEWCLCGNIELPSKDSYYVTVFFENKDSIRFTDELSEPDIPPLIALYECKSYFIFCPIGNSREIDKIKFYYFGRPLTEEESKILFISLLITQNELSWSYDT